MRISDWSSDVCSSDLATDGSAALQKLRDKEYSLVISDWNMEPMSGMQLLTEVRADTKLKSLPFIMITAESKTENVIRSEEHTSELQSIMRISYAVFCLKKKKTEKHHTPKQTQRQ